MLYAPITLVGYVPAQFYLWSTGIADIDIESPYVTVFKNF
jgi:hypothetical protein